MINVSDSTKWLQYFQNGQKRNGSSYNRQQNMMHKKLEIEFALEKTLAEYTWQTLYIFNLLSNYVHDDLADYLHTGREMKRQYIAVQEPQTHNCYIYSVSERLFRTSLACIYQGNCNSLHFVLLIFFLFTSQYDVMIYRLLRRVPFLQCHIHN